MKKIMSLLLAELILLSGPGFAAGRIQDSDVKSLSEVGNTASKLISSTKIYDVLNAQQLSASIANGQLGGGSGGSVGTVQNLLSGKNPDAEKGATTNWTNTSGALTASSTTPADGNYSFQFVASAASQSANSSAVAIPAVSYGQNGLVRFSYKTTNSDFILQVTDGTNTIAAVTLPAATNYTYASGSFIMPSSGNVQVKVVSASAGQINFDDVFVGENFQLGTVSQATLFGSASWSGGSGNVISNASFTNMSSFSSTPPISVKGSITASSTEFAVTAASLPPGEYMAVLTGEMRLGGGQTDSVYCNYRFSDGTTGTDPVALMQVGSSAPSNSTGFSGRFSYSTAQSNVTFRIQAKQSAASSANVCGVTTAEGATINIALYRFPTAAQQAYTPDNTPASWSGYHDATCSWAIASSSFADPADDSTCNFGTLYSRNLTATSLGNKSPGIQFVAPRAGRYEVMVSGSGANTTGGPGDYVQLTDGSGNALDSSVNSAVGAGYYTPFTMKGIVDVPSTGATTTIKIKMAASSNTYTIGGASVVPYTLQWTLKQLDTPVGMPVIVNSLTSNTPGQERIERASVATTCSTSPCTIARQSGTWVSSITRSGVGTYAVNFLAGAFSSAPSCTLTSNGRELRVLSDPTTSGFSFDTADGSGSVADTYFSMICMGPR
jgi:hypothetical protein